VFFCPTTSRGIYLLLQAGARAPRAPSEAPCDFNYISCFLFFFYSRAQIGANSRHRVAIGLARLARRNRLVQRNHFQPLSRISYSIFTSRHVLAQAEIPDRSANPPLFEIQSCPFARLFSWLRKLPQRLCKTLQLPFRSRARVHVADSDGSEIHASRLSRALSRATAEQISAWIDIFIDVKIKRFRRPLSGRFSYLYRSAFICFTLFAKRKLVYHKGPGDKNERTLARL